MPQDPRQKIISLSQLRSLSSRLRKQGKKIVFTNGTFDILHIGHISYLQKAKSLGQVLMVGVNSDASVKSYKGPHRPINPQKERLLILAALSCVDYVILFSDSTPLRLILLARPHVLAKGADWKKSQIVGAKEVESWGGKVKRISFIKGRSSTAVIKRLGLLS